MSWPEIERKLKPIGGMYIPVKKEDFNGATSEKRHQMLVPGKRYWRKRFMKDPDGPYNKDNILDFKFAKLRNGYHSQAPELIKEVIDVSIEINEEMMEPDFLDEEPIEFYFLVTFGKTLDAKIVKHHNEY